MDLPKYKGYEAMYELDIDTDMLVGIVTGIKDGIIFRGSTFDELVKDFHESIDEYLDFCKEYDTKLNIDGRTLEEWKELYDNNVLYD